MNADAEDDAPVLRHAGVALDHRVLHLDGATNRVHNAAELDDDPIAGAFDDPAVMHGDGRIDQVAAQRTKSRQNAILVGAGKPTAADHVRAQDGREFAGLVHRAPPCCPAHRRHFSKSAEGGQPRPIGRTADSGRGRLGTRR